MENESLNITLAIFIGLAITFSLQNLVTNLYFWPWIVASLFLSTIAILFVSYFTTDGQNSNESGKRGIYFLQAFVIISIALMPFALQKMFFKNSLEVVNSLWAGPFQMPRVGFGIYLIISAALTIWLAVVDDEKIGWKRWMIGILGGIIAICGILSLLIKIPGTI